MHRFRGLFWLALGTLGCSAADFDAGDASDGRFEPTAQFGRALVENDLVLTLTQALAAPYEHRKNPRLDVALENRSLSTTYAIVVPNDGSDAGWREPHVGFTLEGAARDGDFTELPPRRVGRCGVYDEDWQKDLKTLGPGERVSFAYFPFYSWPERNDLERIRFTAHYSYGEHARDPSKIPPELRSMPAYALASEPLELEVARPLELRVRHKGGWPEDPSVRLADFFEIELENRSTETLPYESPERGANLVFEMEDANKPYVDGFSASDGAGDVARESILPGEVKSLLGTEVEVGLGSLFPPKHQVTRLRVVYVVLFEDADTPERRAAWGQNERVVVSDWVELSH